MSGAREAQRRECLSPQYNRNVIKVLGLLSPSRDSLDLYFNPNLCLHMHLEDRVINSRPHTSLSSTFYNTKGHPFYREVWPLMFLKLLPCKGKKVCLKFICDFSVQC